MDIYLIIGIMGLFFSILFSSSEIALISSSELQINVWERQNNKLSTSTKFIIENKIKFLTLCLIGTTLSNILAASYFTVYFNNLNFISSNLIFIPIAIIILTFGEILPKTLIKDHANTMLLVLSPILTIFYYLLYPVVIVMSKFEIIGPNKIIDEEKSSEKIQELEHAFEQIDDDEEIEEEQKEIISNIFDYRTSIAEDIMTSKESISSVSKDSNLDELAHIFIDSGHSKLPVYDNNINNIIGVVYLYDLYLKPNSLSDIIKDIQFIPFSKPLPKIMEGFKKSKQSICIVLDNDRKTAGLITIEDIFEELFGDFEDEFDYEKFKSIQLKDGSILVNARINIDDFNAEFHNIIPKGNYETISGYIIKNIGRIPNKNESLFLPIGQIVIKKASVRRIEQVQIYKN